jgi:hypothetical protein
MQNGIDLRPLCRCPDAMEMVLLARGQLNQAFRKHGLLPPDSLKAESPTPFTDTALDNPVASGMDNAIAQFGEVFTDWANTLPTTILRPVLAILLQTWKAQGGHDRDGPAGTALLAAYRYLQGQLEELERGQEPSLEDMDIQFS